MKVDEIGFILNCTQTYCTFANYPFRDQWLSIQFRQYETHSVYVQNIDIRGRKERVLHERRNHVPRVELMRGRCQRMVMIQTQATHMDERRDDV